MKNIEWQECIFLGRMGNFSPTKTIRSLYENLNVGTHIVASYKELYVHMHIRAVLTDNKFIGKILYFEPVYKEKPNDLQEDDYVIVEREHIFWIYDD